MTAEEADARFAALVTQYRDEGRPKRRRKPLVDGYAGLAMLLVYVVGVVLGSVWHASVGKAIVLGVLVFVVRWAWMKFSPTRGE